MTSKKLTYHQFKQIAGTLGKKISDPNEFVNVSGITDLDYDLLHEYLSKWKNENQHFAEQQLVEQDQQIDQQTDQQTDQQDFGKLDTKSLMALFRSTLESSNDGLIIIDNYGKLIDWNDKFFEIAGIPMNALEEASEEIGLEYIFNQVKDPQKLMIELGRLEEENSMKGDFGEVEFMDGRTVERYTQPLILDNKPVGRVWCFKDITEEKAQRDRINILTSAIQSATQGIIVLDKDEIVYMNDYFVEVVGIKELDNKHNRIIDINNSKLNLIYRKICQQLDNSKLNRDDQLLEVIDGNRSKWFELATFNSEYNDKNYVLGIINNVTRSKQLQDQLAYNAYHDQLTGLANRNKVLADVRDLMLDKHSFSIYFMDLDNFKLINDSLGHHNGDILLRKIGVKLKKFLSEAVVVGRIGGDEFVVVIDNAKTPEENEKYLSMVKEVFASPILIKDYEFSITYSMGVAIYPSDADSPLDLIKNADSAMYQRKINGKNGVSYYDATIKSKNMRKVTIANQIYKAIERDELSLVYQPIYDLQTGAIVSTETLIRWNNEELGGFVNPEEFIAVTEEIGYIDIITYWVFERALKQILKWHELGYDKLRLTLNLSGALLYNPKMIDNITKIIKDSGVAPSFITVELTENVFINDQVDVISMLNQLSEIGLKIAMDDFGTGYSSFAYLHRLPIDVIKIDKQFTQSLFEQDSKENTAIILSIIELGRYAGYDVVAEGVETINQMDFLKEHSCTFGQGYHFSRPVPAKDMESLLYEDSLKFK